MTLPNDFRDELPLKSDAELCDMLAHEDDWLPQALTAARQELENRSLGPRRIADLEAAVQSQKTVELAKAEEPLDWPTRIFIFLLCAGIAGAILAAYYDSKGYKTKARECWLTLAASVAVHVVVGALVYAHR